MPTPIEAQTAREAETITPNDSAVFENIYNALYIGGDGNLVVRAVNSDSNVTINGAKAGTFLLVAVDRVLATGTTATGILGLRY